MLVPDLETDITFNARCFYDADNIIKSETITAKKCATDGCGFITPYKAKELADRLELNYVPSAFQVRYGQVKGILLVFDFGKYSNGIIKEDILFTESMWKSDFDVDKATFLVGNISKEPRNYTELNYQIFCCLNSQLSFDDILPFRKLNCVSHKSSSYWYRYLKQVILFNVYDETNLGMGGADFDGDFCFLTKLFVDKFQQTNYIIYNNNNTGGGQSKEILTEELVQRSIRANLCQNMLGVICNINTRTLGLMNDGDSIMANIQRYIQKNIIGMEVDTNSCFSIMETLKGASCLDFLEADRIIDDVRKVYKSYCREIAANISALKEGSITDDDFNNALENTINTSDEKLRAISSDRTALAFAAYTLSLLNGNTSQSFPFLIVLDGMIALLTDVKSVDFYDIRIRQIIPDEATHLIVYKRRCRLIENICPDKTYFGDVNLPNGSYELHRDLKGGVSLIVPKSVPKDRLNTIPCNDFSEFSLKVSYKASELLPEHQNGEYITQLMSDSVITFRESTIGGNLQYCAYAGDTWIGSIFDDQSNNWVLKKDVVRTLTDNEYRFVKVPRTGKTTDTNSFVTGTGSPRTAQVLTFVQA